MPAKSMFDLSLEGKELDLGDLTGTELMVVERFNTGTNAQETCVLTLHTLKQWLALPDICTPTQLNVPFVVVNDFVEFYYRVDYGSVLGGVELYQASALETNSRNVISDLFLNSVGGLSGLFIDSNGGVAAFRHLNADGFASGGDGSVEFGGASPVTINLLTFADAGASGDYDFVLDVFGESVSIHSCGAQDWPPV